MPTIFLVRHGRPAAGFDADLDPGLDPTGRRQADLAADHLESRGPCEIISSPLARARETAVPLSRRWRRAPQIEPRVAELPSPTQALPERARYVRGVMSGTWSATDVSIREWRDALLDWTLHLEDDCVVFSHFIAINAIVGAAGDDDRVIVFRPDHASITSCVVRDREIVVAERGREAATDVR